jgi:flavin reductase (DIM6/NTAB) family NADH-FMN oxidoreductase RutF
MFYSEMDLEQAYRLIGHGPVVWVSTCSEPGKYDIAPIAWNCPVKKAPPRILVGIGQRHLTFENIKSQKEFIVCVPVLAQAQLVRATGSVSGNDVDKFAELKIDFREGKQVNARIPVGCLGYMECRVEEIHQVETLSLVVGEVLCAGVNPDAFEDNRLLVDRPSGKTLHHLGKHVFAYPSDEIDLPK